MSTLDSVIMQFRLDVSQWRANGDDVAAQAREVDDIARVLENLCDDHALKRVVSRGLADLPLPGRKQLVDRLQALSTDDERPSMAYAPDCSGADQALRVAELLDEMPDNTGPGPADLPVWERLLTPFVRFDLDIEGSETGQTLQPFVTDHCSFFPDGVPFTEIDWGHCCDDHDHAYWKGGTVEERVAADEQLQACVLEASGSAVLADAMYLGVRIGGIPYVGTPFRWGFGWPEERIYQSLSIGEEEMAAHLEHR